MEALPINTTGKLLKIQLRKNKKEERLIRE